MRIKAKLRSIGTSKGIIIPAEKLGHYNVGDWIDIIMPELENNSEISTPTLAPKNSPCSDSCVIKPKKFNTAWCDKHSGYKGSCGCI